MPGAHPVALDFQSVKELALLDTAKPIRPLAEIPDLIQANSDIEAAVIWLETTTDNPKTRRAMRKEAERFILWGLFTKTKQLSQMNVTDIKDYILFWQTHSQRRPGYPKQNTPATTLPGALSPAH